MAVGHAGDLQMADLAGLALSGQVLAQFHRQVALDDLAVVQVHLHLQAGRAYGLHQRMGLVLAVQVIARDVSGVDRLDQHRDAQRRGLRCGPGQIGLVGLGQRFLRRAGRRQTGHHVHSRASQRDRVRQGLLDEAAAEFGDPVRQAGQPALARLEVAGWRVEQRLGQPQVVQAGGDLLAVKCIGKQVLDRVEAVGRSGRKAVEEAVLGVHHRQVGGESRHGFWLQGGYGLARARWVKYRSAGRHRSPDRAEAPVQLFEAGRVQRCRPRLDHQPQLGGLFQFF